VQDQDPTMLSPVKARVLQQLERLIIAAQNILEAGGAQVSDSGYGTRNPDPLPGVAWIITGFLVPRHPRLGEGAWDAVALPVPGEAVRPLPPPERGEGR